MRTALLGLAASRDPLGTSRLPFDLTLVGAPRCALLQDMVVGLQTLPTLSSVAALPLGTEAQLRGLQVYFQWVLADAQTATP